jgi:hypothetical protein
LVIFKLESGGIANEKVIRGSVTEEMATGSVRHSKI